jgi:FtsP/CotA-like multicopper oxidase with cupredoxin domain
MHEGIQIDLGLYGPILIHGPGEPEVALDQILVLDDMLLGEDGEMLGLDPHGAEPHDSHAEQAAERMGNTLLANGVVSYDVPVTRGSWVLFRLINVATTRIFGMRLEGHRFVVVGTDGGFVAEPWETDFLPIGVGERFLVLVQMTGQPGRSYAFTHEPQPEDPFAEDPLPEGPHVMATVTYDGGEVAMTPRPAVESEDVPDMRSTTTIDHTWVLDTIFARGDFRNAIDGALWPDIPVQTYPRDGDYTFVIDNRDDGPHPFHTHGNRFQVVQRDGVDVDERGWKDTVLLPGASSVMIRTVLDNPGRWMYHCHILAHQEEGMMAEMIVE